MRRSIAFLLVVSALGCGHRGDSRLSGAYVSDKAATLTYLESTGHYNTNKLAKIGDLLGKLTVEYDGNEVTSVLGGWTETKRFKVLEKGANHVCVETRSNIESLGEIMMMTNRIEFTVDGYWTTSAMMRPPFKEKFVRKRGQ